MTRILTTICCALALWALTATAARADAKLYARSSVLAEGRWVKVRVANDGIYKLTYDQLRAMGFADPAKVSVHGYGGYNPPRGLFFCPDGMRIGKRIF